MPALLRTTQIQEPSSASVNLTLDTNGNGTFAGTSVMSSPYTMRNKIINGAMVIDQRNAGASVTPASGAYTLDRWAYFSSQASKFTVQQNAGSVTPPTGYSNYLGATVISAVSLGAADNFYIEQKVEGLNTPDLSWGTASAVTVTLSFWVRSSLTGTFGGGIRNSAETRSYPFSYTISSANTWEQKSVTIAGDTTGTWLTTNGVGLKVAFSLGMGSTYSGTAGSWAATNYASATGATSVVGTNGATFYITGVQLERGTVATPFEYRNYQQELAMCYRYYQNNFNGALSGMCCAGNNVVLNGNLLVPMRANPTLSLTSGTTISLDVRYVGAATTTPIFDNYTTNYFSARGSISGQTPSIGNNIIFTGSNVQASAEL